MDAFEQVTVAGEEGAVNPVGASETGDGDVSTDAREPWKRTESWPSSV
ncbi:hypothetical protein [Streptomyces sp. NPDC001137]